MGLFKLFALDEIGLQNIKQKKTLTVYTGNSLTLKLSGGKKTQTCFLCYHPVPAQAFSQSWKESFHFMHLEIDGHISLLPEGHCGQCGGIVS